MVRPQSAFEGNSPKAPLQGVCKMIRQIIATDDTHLTFGKFDGQQNGFFTTSRPIVSR